MFIFFILIARLESSLDKFLLSLKYHIFICAYIHFNFSFQDLPSIQQFC